ncbi:MAG TPA: dihydropteroate synthase [Oligoflexus sp.]|uniref:dihydropteroate synthase n=1 Tax=Oligoflexus sp. TaxID=1971216 RepID=UPI002D474AF3|nr:dihydropteroate synthase [Oligoflexus sp.]HYX33576.1 dihydropteroate synthase [Oligoflexus sp.]
MNPAARTLIIGVINVTPDSFSDGGTFLDPEKAVAHAWDLVDDGADVIDIGAESTRPGSAPVDADEEWRRLEPVLAALADQRPKARISLDTYKPMTMRRALDYPVDIINDISGVADRRTLETLAKRGLIYWAMHMHRDPANMHKDPLDGADALREVAAFYDKTQTALMEAGFAKDHIWLDPGVGFGKTDRANVQVIQQALAEASRFEIVLGVSRKSFIGRLLGITDPKERDAPSKMLELSFLFAGVRGIRTHDVARLRALRDLTM